MVREFDWKIETERLTWIRDIKVLVWDLDGALYPLTPIIQQEIHTNAINLISNARLIPKLQAEELFERTYQQLSSIHQTLIQCGVDRELVLSGDWYSQAQLRHLKRDRLLVDMFGALKDFRHIICTNGTREATVKKLKKLGLSLDIFEKIFTAADMYGITKPDLAPFRGVLEYTGLEPNKHLFMGDREKTDVVPAKKVGMRTCLVWGESEIADVSLPKVYDVVKLFQ